MSLLIRRCGFNNYWRYMKLINPVKIRELHISSLINPRSVRNLCNLHVSPNILDDRIRRCLDYVANQYKNKSLKNNNFFEFIDLNTIDGLLNERIQLVENIQNLQDLAKQDVEMKKLAEEEEALYKEQLNKLDKRLLDNILINICKESYDNIIVEITAGVGGQEAMLFVKDLYDMYMSYAKYLGLTCEVIDMATNDNNGIRHISVMMSGDETYKLQYEGGVHRVQRIPATENSGRVHTSTASVAILPAPSKVQIAIDEKDLKIETKRASGAGGQHVNTTDSAVRIIHLPSGLSVSCQVHRSQIKNKEMAMTKLRCILYEQQLNKQTTFLSELRQKQMGMRFRNEKVRTYNYNQDRVTDHRLQNGTLYNLSEFMQGGVALEKLEERLHKDMQMKTLLEVINKLETQLK
ncbi:peptide chain release factor 1-like, mitochondrial [Cataglyphis hispanica]|uniref:peptide chain release factor 1-like, mitochondrial n=1 Tax=Cataglyphis hispanica TaxID=1086592 RepID=UPI00217F7E10|nr:peptide chain release factor 1-like, mitochondrial [Cataglyphis hispanica]XP_050455367.1 peptide chain release factor 1-like, mitochondrial [Cataglyphis hispanica]